MYIVNPLYIYMLGILPKLGFFFGITGVTFLIFSVFMLCGFLNPDEKKYKKIFSISLSIGLVFVLISILIPNKETITTMIVAKCLTVESVQTLGNTGKDIVDYMFDRVEELQNNQRK